ncbi:MAG: hypothetical protein U5L09_15980 [Bacteroidales bacterium]|nr:hypothetical protein [Bacteroidales bacterium]
MKYYCYLLLLVAFVISGCSNSDAVISELQDLQDETISIGAMTGSTGEQLALTRFPQAATKSFDDIMDGVAALQGGPGRRCYHSLSCRAEYQ